MRYTAKLIWGLCVCVCVRSRYQGQGQVIISVGCNNLPLPLNNRILCIFHEMYCRSWYEDCVYVRSWYQGKEQIITSLSLYGIWLLFLVLGTCLWHTNPHICLQYTIWLISYGLLEFFNKVFLMDANLVPGWIMIYGPPPTTKHDEILLNC